MRRCIQATVREMEHTIPDQGTGGINFFVPYTEGALEFNSADPIASYGRCAGDETRGSLLQDFLTVEKICSFQVPYQFYSLHLNKLFRRIHNLPPPPHPTPYTHTV